MKTTVKNHLRKDVKVLGRSVPIFLILLIGMSGLGAAALISMYGSASGTTSVQQSVTLNGQDYDQAQSLALDGQSFVAGTQKIETHYLKNNANVPETVQFNTTCSNTAGQDGAPQTAHNIDWSTIDGPECDGITTQYLEYYDDATADFSEYSAPASCDATVTSGDSIQTAVNNATNGDTVCVDAGTYSETVNVNTPVTLAALNAPDTGSRAIIDGKVNVRVDGVSVKGFKIDPESLDASGTEVEAVFVGNPSGFTNTADSVVIDSNIIESFTLSASSKTAEAIHAKHYDAGDVIDGLTITNNRVKGVNQPAAGANGLKLQANLSNVAVTGNTFENIQGSWTYGIAVTYSGSESGYPTAVTVTDNTLHASLGVDQADASELTVMHNNFVGSGDDLRNFDSASSPEHPDTTLVADDNWFGTNGIQTVTSHPGDSFTGDIQASYQIKSDMTLQGGEKDFFGLKNDFAINLAPDDYTLTLQVVPQ